VDDTYAGLLRQVRQRIEMEQRFGLDFDSGVRRPRVQAVETRERAAAPVAERPDLGSKAEQLAALEREMADCHACPLAKTRHHLVFGTGNPDARLVFVGEAPGEDEDLQGFPFVGRAGQLLTKIIENGMKMRRADVYICNVLKCRPPGNRQPTATEMFKCIPYLERQLEIVRPKVICALGLTAAQALLSTDEPMGRLRGTWQSWRGIPVMVTYHPAYLLRAPAAKAKTWADIQQVMAKLAE
jgi:uracil-DNA glycosylase family 4